MILRIINAIRNNLLVCFPTETIYALACSALDGRAIKRIYQVKKRSQDKPLSIFVNDINSLTRIAKLEENYISLINHFSPGPITYILPLKSNSILPSEFFKGTIGIRIPDHPIAISILNELKIPLIATSVNISGERGVYKASDIPKPIKQHLSAVIEDDKLVSGIESTIVDLTQDGIKVIREGIVSLQMVNEICFQTEIYERRNEKGNRS